MHQIKSRLLFKPRSILTFLSSFVKTLFLPARSNISKIYYFFQFRRYNSRWVYQLLAFLIYRNVFNLLKLLQNSLYNCAGKGVELWTNPSELRLEGFSRTEAHGEQKPSMIFTFLSKVRVKTCDPSRGSHFFHHWNRGRGGPNFSSILSKIVA